jgi:hypothetical protein
MHRKFAFAVFALAALSYAPMTVRAEMGPCNSICGSGGGAARLVPQTTSPSHRLALAWRLTNRPPTDRLKDDDPDLETLIVRIEDGAILAKSPGVYWNTGDWHAKASLSAAWSSDSRLMVRTLTENDRPSSVELFAFADDDGVTGPFDLVKVLDPAARAEMKGIKDANKYSFEISYQPAVTIDDRGLIHASVFMAAHDSGQDVIYNLTAQVAHDANSLDAKVVSIKQYLGPYISVTVH